MNTKTPRFKTDRKHDTAKTTWQGRAESLRRKEVRRSKYTQNKI